MSGKNQKSPVTDNEAQTEPAQRASASGDCGAVDGATDGILILDADTGRVRDASPSLMALLGLSRGDIFGKTVGELRPFKDVASNQSVLERLLGNGHVWHQALPLATSDDRQLAVELIGNVCQAGGKNMIQCRIRDITARKLAEETLRESEERYRGLFEHMVEGYAYCKMIFENGEPRDWTYLAVNPMFEKLTGLKGVAGKRVTEVIPRFAETDSELFKIYARVSLTSKAERFEFFVQALQQWFDISVYSPEKEFFVAVFDVITDRKRAENDLRKLNRALRLISLCNQELVRATDEAALLQAVCRLAVEQGGYRLAWVGFAEQDEAKSVRPAAQAGFEDGYLDTVNITWADVERGRGPVGTAIRTAKTVRVPDSLTDPTFAPWRVEASQHGYASCIALPLITEDRCIGALTLYAAKPDAFDPEEIELLNETAADLAYGINALRHRAERMRAMEALRESERRFQTLADISPVGIFRTNTQGRTTFVNPQWCAIAGLPAADALGDGWLRAVHPEDRAKLAQDWQAATRGQSTSRTDYRFLHPDGTITWVMGQAVPEKDDAGCVGGYVGTITDITERKGAENALRASQQLMEAIINSIPASVFWKDKNLRYLGCNAAFAHDAGLAEPKDLIGKDDYQMVWRDQAELYRDDDRKVIESGRSKLLIEEPQTTPEGKVINLLTSKLPLHNAQGEITGLLGVYFDITGRKRMEESQSRLATAVEQAAETIIITDLLGTIVYANPAFEKSSGYTRAEALGQNPRLLKSGKQDAEFYRRMWETIGRGDIWSGHLVNRRKDGALYAEEATISPVRDAEGKVINYVAVKRDVTRERQLEAQMQQAQKMEAIGQLASGVAHDFNNILGVIIGYSDLLISDLDPESPFRNFVEEIQAAAERASGLTRQLLLFSRKQKVEPVVLDLNDAVKDLDKMLRRLIGEHIEMTVTPGKDLGHIQADPGHVGQVLMNLVINARDAMPDGGKLTIATRNVALGETRPPARCRLAPGDYVMLSVSDTGIGMTPEVKARLFEALFTTKPAGKGTGLGLATCQTIVQQSGGCIDVESEAGQGATFKIYFPRVDKPLETAARSAQTGPLPRGKETLLLVEDEPSVRHLAANVLEIQGYTVLRANNGQEALNLVQSHNNPPIRLVVTDIVMPRMGGKMMADWLKTIYPDLKILFTSGYTDDPLAQQGVLEPGVAFLPKPYAPAVLARKVRAMLDDETDTAQLRKQSAEINQPPAGST